MKSLTVSMLGTGLSAALLLAGCLQDDSPFIDKSAAECATPLEPGAIFLLLYHADEGYGCSAFFPMNSPSDCIRPLPAGETFEVSAEIDWFGQPGFTRISDDCGGTFDDLAEGSFAIDGLWHAPSNETECSMTVEALDFDDNVLASAVVNFEFGERPPRADIQASVVLEHQNGTCRLEPGQYEVECDPVLASDRPTLYIEVDWDFAQPGIIELGGDICSGELDEIFNDGTVAMAEWQPPGPGTGCTESSLSVYTGADFPSRSTREFRLTVPLL